MKKAVLFLAAALMLSSCVQGNNSEITETVMSEETASFTEAEESDVTESEPTAPSETIDYGADKYLEAEEKISDFMGRFTSLGTGNYDDIQSCIITEEADAMGQSAEGGGSVKYMTDDGKLLRYKLTLDGETGCSEKNYYIINENCAYYTSITMDYYCLDYRQEQFGDILNYLFEEYWLDNGEYYRIDRINSALIPCEKNPAEFFEKYLAE